MAGSLLTIEDFFKGEGDEDLGTRRRTSRSSGRDQGMDDGNGDVVKVHGRKKGRIIDPIGDLVGSLREEIKETQEEVKEARGRLREDAKGLREDVKELREYVRELREDVKELREENERLKAVIENLTSKQNFETYVRQMLKELEEKLDEVEQYSRNKNLVIDGIPMGIRENATDVILALGKLFQCSIKMEDVDIGHGMPGGVHGEPGKLIVRFVRREARNEFLAKSKDRPLLTGKDLGLDSNYKISVRENLTKRRSELLLRAKGFKKSMKNPEGKFKFVWTKNGEIFMKANEGERVIKISREEDLPKT